MNQVESAEYYPHAAEQRLAAAQFSSGHWQRYPKKQIGAVKGYVQ
jgi:hypothetical protein